MVHVDSGVYPHRNNEVKNDKKHEGCLVLLRHGESIWNQQNRFTGWVDISLSHHGMAEAVKAGKLLQDFRFDVAFTSALLRARDTLYEVLKQNRHCDQYMRVHELNSEWYEHFTPSTEDQTELKIFVSDRLNERYYGDLQGQNKEKAKSRYGEEQVHQWRRSYDVPPPGGESLQMTAARAIPYYQKEIAPQLQRGRTVMVSAHGNSLRALVMHLENMTAEEILAYELPTGVPHIYYFSDELEIKRKEMLTDVI